MPTLLRSMRIIAAAATLVVAGFSVTAWAGGNDAQPHPRHTHCMQDMQHHLDRRLQRLHDDLHLSAGQADAWQSYEKTIRTQMQTLAQHRHEGHEAHAETAPQRLDRHVAAMQAWLAALKPLAAATHTFYDQLSPTQKTIFDLESRHHRHHHHHRQH